MKVTNKLIAEFLGTLVLVTAALLGGGVAAAAALCACIYAMGHVSGAHYNPAVSLGIFLRGRMSQGEMIQYMAAQAAGAVGGVLLFYLLKDAASGTPEQLEAMAKAKELMEKAGTEVKEVASRLPFFKALIAEFIFTFLLVTTVLHVATTRALANNGFYGAAIALCVLAGATAVGSISGGAFNPAVGLALVMSGKYELGALFVYLLGGFGGGAAAAILFRIMQPHEHSPAVDAPANNTPPPPPAA